MSVAARTEWGDITSEKLSEFTNFEQCGKRGNYDRSDEVYWIKIDYIQWNYEVGRTLLLRFWHLAQKWNQSWNYERYYLHTLKIPTGAEKLQPKLHEVIGGPKTKIYCQGTISEMCLCSATDCQIGCDSGWKSSKTTEGFWKKKKLYFVPI
jgi:hypothetical protein